MGVVGFAAQAPLQILRGLKVCGAVVELCFTVSPKDICPVSAIDGGELLKGLDGKPNAYPSPTDRTCCIVEIQYGGSAAFARGER